MERVLWTLLRWSAVASLRASILAVLAVAAPGMDLRPVAAGLLTTGPAAGARQSAQHLQLLTATGQHGRAGPGGDGGHW